MIKVSAYFTALGPSFSPGAVESASGITFDEKNEPGEVGQKGVFLGRHIPFGSASVDLVVAEQTAISLDLTPVEAVATLCVDHGATDLAIYMNVAFDAQCNMEFDSDFLVRVGKTKIRLAMTCYQDDIASE